MAGRRRNPGWLRWLWDEATGANAERQFYRDVAALRSRPARQPRRSARLEPVRAQRATPKTRPYQVVVRDTHKARTRAYQVVRKQDEFADLADRAERGELKGDALRDFINRFQVERKKRK